MRDVALVHRLGRLNVGETSVLVVVASAHRGAAFDACRWLIDTLKKTVPIWKKEQFVDGAIWADGEPFPDEMVSGLVGQPVRIRWMRLAEAGAGEGLLVQSSRLGRRLRLSSEAGTGVFAGSD